MAACAAAGPPALPRQDRVQRLEAVARLVRGLTPLELGEELLRDRDRVGRVERYHGDGHAGVEHLVRRERVGEDVELGDRVGRVRGEQVAGRAHGAAGDVDAPHVAPQVRARRQEQRQVGVRAEEEHRGGPGRERVRHHLLGRGLPERAVPARALREEGPAQPGVGVDVEAPAPARRHGLPVPAAACRGRALYAMQEDATSSDSMRTCTRGRWRVNYIIVPVTFYLVDQWEVAADVGVDLAGVGNPAVAADADGDVVASHHEEDVVEVVDGVPGVAPLVGVDGDGLQCSPRSIKRVTHAPQLSISLGWMDTRR